VFLDYFRKAAGRWSAIARRNGSAAEGSGAANGTHRSTSAPRLRVREAIARIERQPLPPVILVPIHNAAAEVKDCVTSILAHTPGECRILLLEDASPDPAVDAVLSRFRDHPKVQIHRNVHNLGFTRTVNLGMAIAGRADIVLLNSDTKVTPRWLENLRLAAYSGDRVATATPLSNNAGAFSVPEAGKENSLPGWLGLDDYARLVTRCAARTYPQVPTGNGFCMYIRRDCIDQVGMFDAGAFPRGYGEENDFCMRARRDGWVHVIDDATLIYHVRSASFGMEKDELLKSGRAVLDRRYPDYTDLVREFGASEELRRMRERIAAALAESRASAGPVHPRLLVAAGNGAENGNPPADSNGRGTEERFYLHCDSTRIELFSEIGTRGTLLEAAALPETRPAAAQDVRYEEAVADWLAYHAIEEAAVPATSAHAASLRRLCERLNIPARPC
jgi:GT2 family glycosyltransferase